MRDGTMIGVALLVALVANTAFCDLSVVEKGTIVMISNDYYKLTFDKVRGGTIVALGEHQVTQRDNADGYSLARDEAAEIAIRQISPAQVQISVQARYIEDGKVAESRIEAQYQYLFHADSPLVRCRADIHQNPIAIQAGLPGYLRWQRVTVLDFGDQVGKVTGFSGESTSVIVYFAPAAQRLYEVSAEQTREFEQLVGLRPPRGQQLLEEDFVDKSRWYDLRGNWTAESGRLVEYSPAGQVAWTIAGQAQWENYIVEVVVRSGDGNHVYLAARWQDEDNYYALQYLEWPARCMRIVRISGGRQVILAESRHMPDLRVQPPTHLALAVRGSQLRAYRNDELVLEAYDSQFGHGRVALGVAGNYPVWFYSVDVFQLPPGEQQLPAVQLSQPVQRHGFYRDEDQAQVKFIVSSETDAADLTVTLALENPRYPTQGQLRREEIELGRLPAGEQREVAFEFQPKLWRSGDYLLTVKVQSRNTTVAQDAIELFLRRRPNPDRMLVNCWGEGDPARLAQFGFNQVKVWQDFTLSRWTNGEYQQPDNPMRMFQPDAAPQRQHIIDMFDECLKHGMWGYIQIEYLRRVPEGIEEAYAQKRSGQGLQERSTGFFGREQPRPNPWHPRVAQVICDYYRKALSAWRDLPAWHAVLLNSESECNLDVYGNDYWLQMAKQELGFEVPEDATDPWGAKGRPLPEDGIVDANDPYYRFYRWWWERGEGQGVLHAKVAEAIHQVRPDVVTWHDPALRQPFVRGRLAGLDQILHWSYAHPNVARFPLIADQLKLASTEAQESVLMVQLIVWGTVAIPPRGPHWGYVRRDGQMYLPAHSPTIVREATWLALSRGIDGLSYHGLETVDRQRMTRSDPRIRAEGIGYRGYLYSNPDTLLAVKQMSEQVVQPYGMVIKRLQPAKAPVAMLLSTANSVLPCRDAEDFIADEAGCMYAKLQAAHIPVVPLYEVDLEQRGLDGYKAIALPGCRVLPRHIYRIIREFADSGGIVIADQYLEPEFPNVVQLPRENSVWGGEAAIQEEVLAQAQVVRQALAGKIRRWADCDSPSVILQTLEEGDTKYLFVINNLRRAGDYLGPWGKVLDDGVAQSVRIRVHQVGGVIYEALARQVVEAQVDGEWLTWQVELGPGEGKIFVVRPNPIQELAVTAPAEVTRGTQVPISVTVQDVTGRPVSGLMPLQVTITDSQGRESDYSGYYLAREGYAQIALPIARNDSSGDWRVRACELLGGKERTTFFTVLATE